MDFAIKAAIMSGVATAASIIGDDKPMMMLGPFPFTVSTAVFDSLNTSRSYEYSTNKLLGFSMAESVMGAPNIVKQYLGPNTADITLNGIIYPERFGSVISKFTVDILKLMASFGTAYPLMTASLSYLGGFIIKNRSDACCTSSTAVLLHWE